MRRLYLYGFWLLYGLVGITWSTQAQDTYDRFQCHTINADTLLWLPDSLVLLPGTCYVLQANGDTLTTAQLTLEGQRLHVEGLPASTAQPLQLCFRYLNPAFSRWYYHRALQLLHADTGLTAARAAIQPLSWQLPDRGQLDYSGSFTRGFSVGNRQDLVLNSNFNLQMSGELGDGLQVRAAITDEQIPLQAEGNTQQLQAFDQVFIELSKGEHRLKAGDYELSSADSYFSRYLKKLQGLTYQHQLRTDQLGWDNQLSVALTRGKFVRQILVPIEGNQGPYKLNGAQGERYVIILSGTERVWIDGQLARRGLEADYTIDYNLGELTFTNQQLIRRETRIIVEFEYVEQSYARSIMAAQTSLQTRRHQLKVALFSQQDSRSPSGFTTLTEADRLTLAAAGDDPLKTRISSVRPLEELSPTQVAYVITRIETSCGIEDALVYSTEERSDLQTASFAFVGAGNGLYRQATDALANELVYVYVGRDSISCLPLGDYSADVQLAPPQSQQLLLLRDEWQISPGTHWQTELAWSNLNANRFSERDAADNQGMALWTSFRKTIRPTASTEGWKVNTAAQYEYKSRYFQALNPYRDPEFLRNWSLADFSGRSQLKAATEHLLQGSLELLHPDRGRLEYQLASFLRPDDFTGLKHQLRLDYHQKAWLLRSNSSYLLASTPVDERKFFRPDLRLGRTLGNSNWQAVLHFLAEDRREQSVVVDSLLASSYAFYQYAAEVQSPEEWQHELSLRYQQRTDQLPWEDQLQTAFIARELGVESSWQLHRQLRMQTDFTYRHLALSRPDITFSGRPGNTFLGRVQTRLSLLKGVFRSNINYNLGGGQEPERTYSYIRVRQGEGRYIWLDSLYNGDGIIQPQEMELSPFPDQANYVRVSTFSDRFIPTSNVDLNWSWQLSPRALLYSAQSAFGRFWARFSTQSSLQISRRTQAGAQVQAWNPFQLAVADTSLIAATAGTRHLLFFNRGQTKFDFQLGWSDNRRKFVQNTGFESRTNATKFFKLRWQPTDSWVSNLALEWNQRASDSEFFAGKNYQIRERVLEPSGSWLPTPAFALELRYRYSVQEDQLQAEDFRAQAHELSLETGWNKDSQTNLEQRFSYVKMDFVGQANSPVGFAMLNGLQPGNNLIWNLSLNRQLGRNLQLQLSYEGRKTGIARVVHLGRAQVSATF